MPNFGLLPSPEAGAGGVRMPLRKGEKVITEEGYFAKIVDLSGGAGEDDLMLDLEVTGIGLRAGVPASQVRALETRNRRTSVSRALEPWQRLELLLVRAEGLAADLKELAAVVLKSTTETPVAKGASGVSGPAMTPDRGCDGGGSGCAGDGTPSDVSFSLAELQAGLQTVRPSATELDVVKGFVRSIGLEDLLAAQLASMLQQRRPVDEKKLPIDPAAIAKHLNPGDMKAAWQNGLADEFARAFEEQLRLFQLQGTAMDAAHMNAKFADSTSEGDYGDMEEYLGGIEKHIGLAAVKMYEGMQMQCCDAPESNALFKVPNHGGYETTPKEEWNFVVNPDLAKTSYPGGRRATLLAVYLVAHGAALHDGGARLNMPLEAAALAEVAQQNACSAEELLDSVRTVALRWGRTNYLSQAPLLRAVKKLTRESIGDEHRYTIKGLQALAELTAQKRKELRKALGEALEKAPCVESTGERSFAAVAESVKDLASREILEALVRYARIKLMEAKVCEEEVIGLRLYSGPFFVKVNFVLRNKGMTTGGTNYSNLIHAIVSGTSKLSQVSGIPEDRELYRGIGDTHMPAGFYEEDDTGVRGGVERGMLSMTTDKKVAIFYTAGRKLPTIFSIKVGAVSKGASLNHLSQFPAEEEVLMPPGSFLEVVGVPRVVHLEDSKGSMLEIPMQISCPKTATIEQTRASRKTSLLSMVDHLLLEIQRDLVALSAEDRVAQRAKGDWACSLKVCKRKAKVPDPTREPSLHNARLIPSIVQQCREWKERAIESPEPAAFNDDALYRRVVAEACELKRLAVNKVEVWLEDPNLMMTAVKNMTLAEADWHVVGRWKRALLEAKAAVQNAPPLPSVATWWSAARSRQLAIKQAQVTSVAIRFCRQQGLLVCSADEVLDESSGETMLMRQAALGNAAAVRLLVDAGARCDAADGEGQTALIHCATAGQRETALTLVKECGANANTAGNDGKTPVWKAAWNGHTETVRALVQECGADASTADKNGWTPVLVAAYNGHTETVRALVQECGADASTANKNGATPVYIAAGNGHTETLRALVQECGADASTANKNGATPIYIAAENGHTETLRALVQECGADASTANKNGATPVYIAAENGHTETLRALVQECGADASTANKNGATPVYIAAENGHTETLRALVQECGANASTADKNGATPVMVALANGNWDAASCLVTELEADVQACNLAGASCLHYAAVAPSKTEQAKDQAIKVAGAIMERGGIELISQADLHSGLTPLDCALYVGNEALARMLAERLGSGDDSAASELLEQARRRVLEPTPHAPLSLFRGLPWAVKLGPHIGVFEFSSEQVPARGSLTEVCSAFSTLRSTRSCPPGGKGYYEVEILGLDSTPQYGFATAGFERVRGASNGGVGACRCSWAVDGARQLKFHNGKKRYECTWKQGDVIGLACDLDAMRVHVSVNGSFAAPNGVVFELAPEAVRDGLFAAITGHVGKVRCNLGEAAFKHAPPSADFTAFVHFQ